MLFVGVRGCGLRPRPPNAGARRFAWLAALLAILNAQVLFLSDYFAADLPYTAVSTFFLVAPPGLAAGLLAVGAFGLRTAGVALLGRLGGREPAPAPVAAGGGARVRRRWRQWGCGRSTSTCVNSSAEYSRPAYSYQRADYQFYNVGYSENMSVRGSVPARAGPRDPRGAGVRASPEIVRAIPIGLGEAATLQRGWLVGEVERVREHFPGDRSLTGRCRRRWCT